MPRIPGSPIGGVRRMSGWRAETLRQGSGSAEGRDCFLSPKVIPSNSSLRKPADALSNADAPASAAMIVASASEVLCTVMIKFLPCEVSLAESYACTAGAVFEGDLKRRDGAGVRPAMPPGE